LFVTQVFDLDACCWYPEMYMLFGGGGAPFKKNNDNTLTDASGAQVRLLGDVAASWAECDARMKAGESLLVGVASRSDEPSWARECLRKFLVSPGVTMMDVVTEERCEIYKGSKRDHFAALKRKTGIPYERMCFFDDDPHNISDVGGIGVHCFLTPDGVMKDIFDKALLSVGLGAASSL